TNTVTVSGGSELNTGNNSANDVTAVRPPPDLTITKTHLGNFYQAQTGATYTLTVSNSGLGDTVGSVTVTEALPTGLIATAINGTGWTCALNTLTCTRGDVLEPGASYPAINVVVDVANNAPASVTNTATVSGGTESNTSNDTATDLTTIAAPADLTVVKSHTGSFVQSQTGAVYTITVNNVGNAATTGQVAVIDPLPAALTVTGLSGNGWTCALATVTCTRSDSLAAKASYPAITLTVNVAPDAPGSVTNTVSVSG